MYVSVYSLSAGSKLKCLGLFAASACGCYTLYREFVSFRSRLVPNLRDFVRNADAFPTLDTGMLCIGRRDL